MFVGGHCSEMLEKGRVFARPGRRTFSQTDSTKDVFLLACSLSARPFLRDSDYAHAAAPSQGGGIGAAARKTCRGRRARVVECHHRRAALHMFLSQLSQEHTEQKGSYTVVSCHRPSLAENKYSAQVRHWRKQPLEWEPLCFWFLGVGVGVGVGVVVLFDLYLSTSRPLTPFALCS